MKVNGSHPGVEAYVLGAFVRAKHDDPKTFLMGVIPQKQF